ncbi:hypothetical protein ACFPAG_10775 [Vogesella sp. GCM10023246]|uniref:CHASE domain-containing protein n=1 Tax=Vogesella oryzagri TaxID=3160864 RepID=A0ABV1M4V1_9NEIS
MIRYSYRWPHLLLFFMLLLCWLALALLGGSWLLAYERARAQSELDEQTQQLAAQVRSRLGQLQDAGEQLLQDLESLQQAEAGSDPGRYLANLHQAFPLLQRVALLGGDVRSQQLLVRQVAPFLLGGDVLPTQDLGRQPAVAQLMPVLQAGQPAVAPWRDRSGLQQLLLLPGIPGNYLALWLQPSALLPALADERLRPTLVPLQTALPQEDSWGGRLHASVEVRSGPFALRLDLARQLGWEDIHSPRLWLLLVWLLLSLLLCWLSYLQFGVLRRRRHVLLLQRQAWLQRHVPSPPHSR